MINIRMGKWSDDRGSMTLEAALILPFFMAFVFALTAMIQLSVAELALQSAVSETAKQIAAHLHPVRLMYGEAKSKVQGSKAGSAIQEMTNRVVDARGKLTGAEDFIEQYEKYIPGPIVDLAAWEKARREQLEQAGTEKMDDMKRQIVDPALCRAFQPIVMHYANKNILKGERLQIEQLTVPGLESGGNDYIGIQAKYLVKLPIPFIHKTVEIRKKAYERVWVGES